MNCSLLQFSNFSFQVIEENFYLRVSKQHVNMFCMKNSMKILLKRDLKIMYAKAMIDQFVYQFRRSINILQIQKFWLTFQVYFCG